MIKNRLFIPSVIITSLLLVFFILSASFKISVENKNHKNRINQIYRQERLLKQGDRFVEQDLYARALDKYQEGLDLKFISKDEDKRGPIVRKIRLYRIVGDFKTALNELNNAPASLKLDPELRIELEALQRSSETINIKKPVHEYINHLKQKYRDSLPPKVYNAFSSIAISQILRLYDTIGDYDSGIKFIDEIMEYFKKKDVEKYGKYKPGKVDQEYLKVREAFEKDKAEGFKGCLNAKPGEVCIGRATKALIQSDYFPW